MHVSDFPGESIRVFVPAGNSRAAVVAEAVLGHALLESCPLGLRPAHTPTGRKAAPMVRMRTRCRLSSNKPWGLSGDPPSSFTDQSLVNQSTARGLFARSSKGDTHAMMSNCPLRWWTRVSIRARTKECFWGPFAVRLLVMMGPPHPALLRMGVLIADWALVCHFCGGSFKELGALSPSDSHFAVLFKHMRCCRQVRVRGELACPDRLSRSSCTVPSSQLYRCV